DARWAVTRVQELSRISRENRRRLDDAERLHAQTSQALRTSNHAVAARLLRQALEVRLDVLGKEHREVARTLDHLGIVAQKIPDSAAASSYHQQALAIRKKALGEEHPDTGRSYWSVGVVLGDLNDYE